MSELGRKAASLKLRNNGIFCFDPAERCPSPTHNILVIRATTSSDRSLRFVHRLNGRPLTGNTQQKLPDRTRQRCGLFSGSTEQSKAAIGSASIFGLEPNCPLLHNGLVVKSHGIKWFPPTHWSTRLTALRRFRKCSANSKTSANVKPGERPMRKRFAKWVN